MLLLSIMSAPNNATAHRAIAPGILLGALGVLGFSFTLPATKVAVADLDPMVVGLGRAVVAAALAALVLAATRTPFPASRHWARLVLVALGVVVGFPLFSTLALHRLTAAHGAVITGLLPAATAGLAAVSAGEQPSPFFWLVCLAGLVAVLAFAAAQGAGRPQPADLLALLAVGFGALGYSQGAILARELDGWRVICWALVIALPFALPIAGLAVLRSGFAARPPAWAGFAYVSVVSMFLAFFPWYQGLARGGVARVSQIQLAQPVLTFVWSWALLGEHVGGTTLLAGGAVLACAAASLRTRVRSSREPQRPWPGGDRAGDETPPSLPVGPGVYPLARPTGHAAVTPTLL
jgi:drug/metabolite transporter (DMT)-like permease